MNSVLLVLNLILLLAVLGGLYVLYGSVTKLMEHLGVAAELPRRRRGSDAKDAQDAGYPEPDVDPGGSGVGAEFALGAAATPAAAAVGPAYDPPETDYPAAAGTDWDPAPAASMAGGAVTSGAMIDDSGIVTEPDPSWQDAPSSYADEPVVEPAVEAGVTQRPLEEEPEEQPFERDGRWWFKRGDELLVYDEPTGQWQPAPSPSVQALATNPTSAQAGAIAAELAGLREDAPSRTSESSPSEEEPAGESRETPVADEQQTAVTEAVPVEPQPVREWQSGSFWKCPSCGAVNGSTATSCRMCFAARA
jgi:hypothetical protein